MFSSTLRAALIALAASAVAVSAAPGLSLKVSGPAAVDGVDNLKVTTTVTNTGDETLKLLKDPRGALSTIPANTFDITTDSGESPSFIGAKVKYVPSKAAKSTNARSFTVLAPGESVTIEHDRTSRPRLCFNTITYVRSPSSLASVQLHRPWRGQVHGRSF